LNNHRLYNISSAAGVPKALYLAARRAVKKDERKAARKALPLGY
jgi:hypothetical protein